MRRRTQGLPSLMLHRCHKSPTAVWLEQSEETQLEVPK